MNPIALRHALHKIPELAFEEHKTKALLMSELTDLTGSDKRFKIIQFKHSPGILVEYHGGASEDQFKLFRADMDALPSVEQSGCDFASEHSGLMHACGHDVHMAVLFGLIQRVQMEAPEKNLLFLFQPAEEGKGGAQAIIKENVIQAYPVSSAFALHVGSEMAVGTISAKAGIFFGIPQEFDVRFLGKAAHVAFPEKGVNALACGIRFFNQMESSIQAMNKTERLIFHVGKMSAGQIRNIIADDCTLEGTHRTLSSKVRDTVNQMIESTAQRVAAEHGAKAEVQLLGTYDAVVNDAGLEQMLRSVCSQLGYPYLPAETVMTGEDFGFFTSMYPGLLFWLGSGSDHALHSGMFLPKDDCIEVGINVMWNLTLA